MFASHPYFLRKDDALRAGYIRHTYIRIQIDSLPLVSLISQLVAVEGILCLGVCENGIVRLLGFGLHHTVPRDALPNPSLFFAGQRPVAQWIGNSV